MHIGTIDKSISHIHHAARIYGPRDVELAPGPADFALGSFVRMVVLVSQGALANLLSLDAAGWTNPACYAVGVICDTTLLGQGGGPHTRGGYLSNELARAVFSPDFVEEHVTLAWIQLIGMMVLAGHEGRTAAEGDVLFTLHGVPLLALEQGSEVERMPSEDIRLFHLGNGATAVRPYCGYFKQLVEQGNRFVPEVRRLVIEQLERLFPESVAALRLLKSIDARQSMMRAAW
jgi:hypothetical protein